MSKANRPRYCGTITNPTESGCWIVRSKWRRGEKTIERDKQTFDSQQAAAEYAAELEQRHAPKKENVRTPANVVHRNHYCGVPVE
nr:hypothetical protein [Neisseria meningitidis]DAU37624.1 MAG TPA: hypothetical protein [Caudoviricetes sp.]